MKKPKVPQCESRGLSEEVDLATPCRICFEQEQLDLINPCQCSGSSRYVHTECLKKWVILKYPDVQNAQCEVCKFKYLMKVKTTKKCNPKAALPQRYGYCCLIPMIVFLIMIMIIITIIEAIYKVDFEQRQTYSIILVIFCVIPILLCFGVLFVAIYKVSVVTQVKEWCIKPYTHPR